MIEAPRFRIHAIHDADDAYLRGDLAAAVELYQRAIDDDALLDWPTAGARRQELAAYAAFRRVLSFLAAGDAPNAQAEVDKMAPGGGASAEAYAELARLLLAGYADSGLEGSLRRCRILRPAQAPTRVLAPLDFGYANRAYTAGDICSVPGP